VENDANCCAWGELAFYRMEGIRDFLTILIELKDDETRSSDDHVLAVGFGIVIDGRVHHGRKYSSGEFRSLFWQDDNANQFSLPDGKILLLRNDKEFQKQFIRELARHMAFLVNMFNMSHIFFGGDAEIFREDMVIIMEEELKRNWPYPDRVDCELFFFSQGRDSVSYGAAGLVLNSMFAETALRGYDGTALPDGIDFIISKLDAAGGQ
jgi:hypothetical protein